MLKVSLILLLAIPSTIVTMQQNEEKETNDDKEAELRRLLHKYVFEPSLPQAKMQEFIQNAQCCVTEIISLVERYYIPDQEETKRNKKFHDWLSNFKLLQQELNNAHTQQLLLYNPYTLSTTLHSIQCIALKILPSFETMASSDEDKKLASQLLEKITVTDTTMTTLYQKATSDLQNIESDQKNS